MDKKAEAERFMRSVWSILTGPPEHRKSGDTRELVFITPTPFQTEHLSAEFKSQYEHLVFNMMVRWLFYREALKFKDSVELGSVIEGFQRAVEPFYTAHFPTFTAYQPQVSQSIMWHSIFSGIGSARSHAAEVLRPIFLRLAKAHLR